VSRFSEAQEARLEARFEAASAAYDAAYETPGEDAAFAAMERADKACAAFRDAEQAAWDRARSAAALAARAIQPRVIRRVRAVAS
jgi:hypothetical protein